MAPLQDPLRIAEEWAMVDHLSQGRVEVAFASGWHVNDFVLSSHSYENRKEICFENIKQVISLWQGQAIERKNGNGTKIAVRTFPKPFQSVESIGSLNAKLSS